MEVPLLIFVKEGASFIGDYLRIFKCLIFDMMLFYLQRPEACTR